MSTPPEKPLRGKHGFYGEPYETERRNRIRVALCAFAYEFHAASLISDAEFDKLALAIRPEVETGFPKLDRFFKEDFSPHTGQWVHKHPELNRLRRLYHWRTVTNPSDNSDTLGKAR